MIVVFSIAICYAMGLYLSFMISVFDDEVPIDKKSGGVLYRWINP